MPDYQGLERAWRVDDALRMPHVQMWRDIAEVIYPERDFDVRYRRELHLYDDTPQFFRRQLASALKSMIYPREARWAIGRVEPDRDGSLNKRDDVRAWATDRIERIMMLLYSTRSSFQLCVRQSLNDHVAFGQGWRMLDVRPDMSGLRCRAFHPNDVWASREEGTATFRTKLTRTMAQRLGYPVAQSGDEHKEWCYMHRLMPSESRRWKYDLWVWSTEMHDKGAWKAGSYSTWPLQRPTWEISAGDVYATGPGEDALANSRAVQQIMKTLLIAGHRTAAPPLLAPSDSIIDPMRPVPDGVTFYDAQGLADYGLRDPFKVLESGRNLPLNLEILQAVQSSIGRSFYSHVLELPDRDRMTAAEVAAHQGRMVSALGDVFDSLEHDDMIPMMERAEDIAERMGALPPPPAALEGKAFRFRYWSPISFARQMSEVAGFARSLELMGAVLALQPESADVLNGDEAVRLIAEPWAWSTRLLRSPEVLGEVRQQRAQQQQTMMAMEAAKVGADVAAKSAAAQRAGA